MSQSIKKIISTKTFWIILGLGILFWGLRKYTFWDIDVVYLVFNGPYILPLIIPSIFFYLFVQKRNESYFKTTLQLLILWPIWSSFVSGWFTQQFGGGFSVSIFIISPILISTIISILYLFCCNNILNKRDNLSSTCKKKILWRDWFIGLAVIIIGVWLCSYIWSYIGTKINDERTLDLMAYIVRSIDFLLMWLILTLPATLKIDNILSKENRL